MRRLLSFFFLVSKLRISASLIYIALGWTLLLTIYCSVPNPLFEVPYAAVLTDKSGQLLSARIASDEQWRFPAASEVDKKYVVALVEYEDRRFYFHRGIDPFALFSAFLYNLKHPEHKRGGSTLSMQLIRLALKNPPRSYGQKLKETILASVLEVQYSKKEILNLYASHAPFGGNVVGIEAATWRYLGKNSRQITWAEACLLAVLPNSPGLIHPGRNRDKLKIKRNLLLNRLFRKKIIDRETWLLSKEEPLPEKVFPLPQMANHLLDRTFPAHKGGLEMTTLDIELQERMLERLNQYQRQISPAGIQNSAVLVLDVSSGEVLAYLGNSTYDKANHGRQVDLITANRSSGSILKPFLYALSLQEGLLLPSSWLTDVPSGFQGYKPVNFDHSYRGMVSADQALIQSLNIPFVPLLKNYDVRRFHAQLKKMGISSLPFSADHYGLSLILGGAEVNLWDLCGIYSSMMRSILFYTPGNTKEQYYNWHGARYLNRPEGTRGFLNHPLPVLNPGALYTTLKAMTELKRPDEDGIWQQFPGNQPIAWKTGTSFGFRDAWAIGLSTSYCIGVWVGNASGEGKPGLTGIKAAAPLLFNLFNELPEKGKQFPVPEDDLQQISICTLSGWPAGSSCPKDTILSPKTVHKPAICSFHRKVFLTEDNRFQVHTNCELNEKIKAEDRLVLPPLEAFYFRKYHPSYQPLPILHPLCDRAQDGTNASEAMDWIYPREFSRIKVPKNLDGSLSKTVFQLAHRIPEKVVYWHLDGQFIGKTRLYHQISLQPTAGRHRVMAMDEDGNRVFAAFEILQNTPSR